MSRPVAFGPAGLGAECAGGVALGVGEATVGRAGGARRHGRGLAGQPLDGGKHVDQAVAGVEGRAAGAVGVARVGLVGAGPELVRRVDEQVLDRSRGQALSGLGDGRLLQHGDVPRDVRRGHGGAGDRVVVGVGGVEAGGADRQVDPAGRGDVGARGREVGVGRGVARQAARGGGVQCVVAAALVAVVVVGDGEDTRGGVLGVGVDDVLGAVATVVAGGPDHVDALGDQLPLDQDLRRVGLEVPPPAGPHELLTATIGAQEPSPHGSAWFSSTQYMPSEPP